MNHIKALFNTHTVKSQSASELEKLLDDFSKHLLSLVALGQPVEHWSMILIYMITNKLDFQTKREWEINRLEEDFLKLQDMMLFLNGRCELLEKLCHKKSHLLIKFHGKDGKTREETTTVLTSTGDKTYKKRKLLRKERPHNLFLQPK